MAQFKALRSLLRSVRTVVQYAVLSIITVVLHSATEHGHHVDVVCQPSLLPMVTQAEQISKIAPVFRTTVKFVQRYV